MNDRVRQCFPRPQCPFLTPFAHGAHIPIGKIQTLPSSSGGFRQEGSDLIKRILTCVPCVVEPADFSVFAPQKAAECFPGIGITRPITNMRMTLSETVTGPFGRVLRFAKVAARTKPDPQKRRPFPVMLSKFS